MTQAEKQTHTPLEALIIVMAPGAWQHQPDCDSVAFGGEFCNCGYMDRVRLAQAAIAKATEGIPAETSVVADLLEACEKLSTVRVDEIRLIGDEPGETSLQVIDAIVALLARVKGDPAVHVPGSP